MARMITSKISKSKETEISKSRKRKSNSEGGATLMKTKRVKQSTASIKETTQVATSATSVSESDDDFAPAQALDAQSESIFPTRKSLRVFSKPIVSYAPRYDEDGFDTADDELVTTTETIQQETTRKVFRRKKPVKVHKTKSKFLVNIFTPKFFATNTDVTTTVVVEKTTRVRRTNRYGFTFGVDSLPEYESPTPKDFEIVSTLLEKETTEILKQGNLVEPAHAVKTVTVDSMVRVIMSQATTNEMASDYHQHMIRAYPYYIDGIPHFGTVPNYHDVRVQSLSKLRKVLAGAGLESKKPRAIKELLVRVYKENVSRLTAGEVAFDRNEPGATDFIPGLLSVDYFWEVYNTHGKQGLLDFLVSFHLVGVKSAACIMSFNMGLPVFAVDTHVAAMSQLLGWVPPNTKEDAMCSHLDSRMPDGPEKVKLHQEFWQHRRNCARCSGRVRVSDEEWAFAHCPLEHLIVRPEEKAGLARRPAFGIPQNIRAAKRRAERAAANNVLLMLTPREQIRLRMDGDRVRKGKETIKPKSGKKDEDRIAKGETKVSYSLDDNFDAQGAYVIKREIWVPNYLDMKFDAVDEPKDDDNEECEEIIIRTPVITEK